MARIILEGMDHDNTYINFMAVERDIPKHATVLKTSWGNYELKLKLRSDGKPLPNSPLEAALDTTPIGMFESVQTALVEDGDGYLAYSWAGESRFNDTIKQINAVGFAEAYRQIQQEPRRFYSGAMIMENGVIRPA